MYAFRLNNPCDQKYWKNSSPCMIFSILFISEQFCRFCPFLSVFLQLIAASKAAVPTVGDQAAALQLGNFAKTTAQALADLRSATNKALEACGSLELDSAAVSLTTWSFVGAACWHVWSGGLYLVMYPLAFR